MPVVSISLNKIVEFNDTYFDSRYYVLTHKNYINNLLLFENDIKHRKTYNRLLAKLVNFLYTNSVSQRYVESIAPELIEFNQRGLDSITSSFDIVQILPYKIRMTNGDKFMMRPIPYAFADNKKDMMRLLKNYLIMEDPYEYAIYYEFNKIKWEEDMYFEMYRE